MWIDEPMYNELKIKEKKVLKRKDMYLLYHNINIFEEMVLKAKAKKKRIDKIKSILSSTGFTDQEYNKVLLNYIVKNYKFDRKTKRKLIKQATNKDKEISYHKLYKLKYNYLKKNNKLIVL